MVFDNDYNMAATAYTNSSYSHNKNQCPEKQAYAAGWSSGTTKTEKPVKSAPKKQQQNSWGSLYENRENFNEMHHF